MIGLEVIQNEKLREEKFLQKDEEIAKGVLLELLLLYPEYQFMEKRALFFGYADSLMLLLMCLNSDQKNRGVLKILQRYPICYSKILHHMARSPEYYVGKWSLSFMYAGMNPDYTAVISNMSNLFYDTYHHAYLYKGNTVIALF